ncbi:ABC-type transport auxiliary lipoprotein family protein [Candidatus Nitrosacidococcus tergens]|uniref:ABC-type transport auxiliary lipoprotein component domain-containing protein n=1 Tax=Candidatus Nitrosacidococcus tergens TaxID=553981 RepID=A0A7G1Q9A9_9GAMM|nr:hypothetical protein [Candidatus Nitrosacidococcus tergens]CAB1275854.1 conserved protein of unknown function [Candidatus Nitrosacidococcus tergens]
MLITFFRSFCIFLILCTVSGCTSHKKNIAKQGLYTLEVDRVIEQPSDEARERILEIKPFRISPRYQDITLTYQKNNSWFQTERNQAFIQPPEILITDQISRYLSHTGLFNTVVQGKTKLKITQTLEGAVTALYGDFDNPKGPLAIMEIQFFLLELSPADYSIEDLIKNEKKKKSAKSDTLKMVLQTGFRVETEIAKPTPESLVQGWNNGLESILQNFENDLNNFFKERNPSEYPDE